MKRYTHEPAFVLHHYDWSESSLILETFTRSQGRVSLVAKGAKKPSSNFRPVLLPLQHLELAYSMAPDSEIGTLKAADWVGGYTLPTGDALLAGYYCNELLLRLLAREDVQTDIFDAYASCVALLAMQGKAQAGPLAAAGQAALHSLDAGVILRAFELILLRALGFLPELGTSSSGHALGADEAQHYHLHPERGLRAAVGRAPWPDALPAALWLRLHQALQHELPLSQLLPLLLSCDSSQRTVLRNGLRQVLQNHLGRPLKTRELMADMQQL